MSYAACVYYVTVEHALKSWILVVGKKHITVNKVFATQLPLKLKVHCLKSSLFNILSLVTFIKHRGEIVIILNYEIWRFSKMLWQLPFFFSYPFECWFSQAVFQLVSHTAGWYTRILSLATEIQRWLGLYWHVKQQN